MRKYIGYRTNALLVRDFLNLHLFSYKNFVNITECTRYLVHDYFSAKFDTPYKYYSFNNCLVFLNQGCDKALSPNDLEYIAKTIFSAFWPMLQELNYLMTHCNNGAMGKRPTDCYFNFSGFEDFMVYVPIDSGDRKMPVVEIPEIALLTIKKGGTA